MEVKCYIFQVLWNITLDTFWGVLWAKWKPSWINPKAWVFRLLLIYVHSRLQGQFVCTVENMGNKEMYKDKNQKYFNPIYRDNHF